MTEEKQTVSNGTGQKQRSNRVVATACVAFFAAMVGAAYASVPLYRLFCQVTGYGGTTQRVEQMSDVILDKTINVRFDANTSGALPWDFKPKQRQVTIRIGETKQISYEGRNVASMPTSGRATFNVTPERAGAYFNKVQCFCFTDTTLQPGEDMDMPVVFFVDPEIVNDPDLKDLKTITLSYTFFPIDKRQPVAQSAKPAAGEGNGNL
ncbi:cytochrome C oxidase assembly protein [Paramesorhizobium deserti]|uniref:Cytochrome c oxidase assembly protein CtaG n=1 Tax=Paramesorhizobium deserti TaxID=1494590 RepID=A0A135HYU5_9HYPH|nr:cytochrome c oxidase assembly protein [Paramesorhizobium deserti]KXF78372.1 cytochrome C oxidase assembly protein [Paramesorhizobium deserti]